MPVKIAHIRVSSERTINKQTLSDERFVVVVVDYSHRHG